MSQKSESAELILRAYELRREAKLREAREWFGSFLPESAEEILAVARGEKSAYYRMVTTYWDMVASLVNHGAIDSEMFHDANNEHVYVFAKLAPHLAALREATGQPRYLSQLEHLVQSLPDAEARIAFFRKRFDAARAAAAPKTTAKAVAGKA